MDRYSAEGVSENSTARDWWVRAEKADALAAQVSEQAREIEDWRNGAAAEAHEADRLRKHLSGLKAAIRKARKDKDIYAPDCRCRGCRKLHVYLAALDREADQ